MRNCYAPQYTIQKLEKGDYTLKMHVRHEKKELLDRLTDMPLLLSQKLNNPIILDIYASQSQAMISGKKMVAASVPPGHILPLFVAPMSNENKQVFINFHQFHVMRIMVVQSTKLLQIFFLSYSTTTTIKKKLLNRSMSYRGKVSNFFFFFFMQYTSPNPPSINPFLHHLYKIHYQPLFQPTNP